jgi:hypothetical protein
LLGRETLLSLPALAEVALAEALAAPLQAVPEPTAL